MKTSGKTKRYNLQKVVLSILLFLLLMLTTAGIWDYFQQKGQNVNTNPLTSVSPTPNIHASSYNYNVYFSLVYPRDWHLKPSACTLYNDAVSFLALRKTLSNGGTAGIDICVFTLTSYSGNSFRFNIGLRNAPDLYETHTTNQVINGNRAYVTEQKLTQTPGVLGFTKNEYILHGNFVYWVILDISVNATDEIQPAIQTVLPEFSQIVSSLDFKK